MPENPKLLRIEHPTGGMALMGTLENGEVTRTEVLRTARKLLCGLVVPWARSFIYPKHYISIALNFL